MQAVDGILMIVLGQFILMRSYAIRKLMLILHGALSGLMMGLLLAALVLVGMGAAWQSNNVFLPFGIILVVGCAIAVAYLAGKLERLYIIITAAITLFGLIASLAVLLLLVMAAGGRQGMASVVLALLILVAAVLVTIKLFRYIVAHYQLAFVLQTCLIGAGLVVVGVIAIGALVCRNGRMLAAVLLAQLLLTGAGALYQWNRYQLSRQ